MSESLEWNELAAGYLVESLTDDQVSALLEICSNDAVRRAELASLVRTDRLITARLSPVSENERTQEIMARLQEDGPDISSRVVLNLRNRQRARWLPLAAAIALLLSTVALVIWDRSRESSSMFAEAESETQVTLRYEDGDQVTVKSNQSMELVAEKSDVTLPHDVPATLSKSLSPANRNAITNQAETLPAGTRVDSYLLHFDPSDEARDRSGEVTFDRPILAVIALSEQLNASDALFSSNRDLAWEREQDRLRDLNRDRNRDRDRNRNRDRDRNRDRERTDKNGSSDVLIDQAEPNRMEIQMQNDHGHTEQFRVLIEAKGAK